MSQTRRIRMSNQVMDAPTTTSTRYLIQVYSKRYEEWTTLECRYRTAEQAHAAALDSRKSPVAVDSEWRIVKSVCTFETVDTSGM